MSQSVIFESDALVRADAHSGNGHPVAEQSAESGSRPPASADIHPGVGFRIKLGFPRSHYDVLSMFEDFSIADISDHLNRLYAVDSAIRCLSGENRRLGGPACTVKVYPGDNLMVHKVLDLALPGDVVVIDARGSAANAVLGDTVSMKARHRGIAGFIVDGYVRDLSAIRELDYPIYARGDMPIGPLHRGPGEINYPVCCGGIVVEPGDFVIADPNGIVVLPRDCIKELHAQLSKYKERLSGYLEKVRRGEFSNAWVDQLIESARCEIDV